MNEFPNGDILIEDIIEGLKAVIEVSELAAEDGSQEQ
jgi:hypothetical protein